MMCYSQLLKTLAGLLVCGSVSQHSAAQRTAVERLTPVQPQLQLRPSGEAMPLRTSSVQISTSNSASATSPPTPVTQLAVWPQPLFILDAEVIIGPDFPGIQPHDIEKLIVYKDKNTPWQWRNLATNGIIDITLTQKMKLKSRSFADLGKGLGLAGPIVYTVNGMLVAEPSLRIAVDAIGEIKITRAASATTVAISVRSPKPSPPAPPGTIRIRGLAS